jgi:hypothetical protein
MPKKSEPDSPEKSNTKLENSELSRSKNETDFDESEEGNDDDSVIQESIKSSRKEDRESKFSEKEKSKEPTFDFS